jgi:uncharacterized membrane protein YkoI
MNQLRIGRAFLFGLALTSLAIPSSTLYAKDLQQNGTIKANKLHKNEYSNSAKVTLQDAVSAATKKVPGKAIEAELESEDGYLVYEVKVISPDKKVTQVYVDAGNASVLGTELKSEDFS